MEESRSMERQPDLNMTRQSSSGASLQARDVDGLGAHIDSSELVTVFYPQSNSRLITSLSSTTCN
jgi:hypothetical protein